MASTNTAEIKRKKVKPKKADVRKAGNAKTPGSKFTKAYFDHEFGNIIQAYKKDKKRIGLNKLEAAYEFSYKAHEGQTRESGVPYFEHVLEVVRIVAQLNMDPTTLVAAFLHDVIEDTEISLPKIKDVFGEKVCHIVDGLTKISEIEFGTIEERKAKSYYKLLISMARDVRVIVIKLADRLHNMHTIHYLPEEKRERIAIETRDIYAPLAHRFGMGRIQWDLEDLVLKTLDEESFRKLQEKISQKREEREDYVSEIIKPLKEKLRKINLEADITGRPKHFYSIYNKMVSQGKTFEEIYDLIAIRIIVNSKEDCYRILGLLHSIYTPVNGRLKDYIGRPKENGYQSIHTTVLGPRGKSIEIQIRTRQMHYVAEEGIAAHWMYKSGQLKMDGFDQLVGWVRSLVEGLKESDDASEFLENLKQDLDFGGEIFVLTPKSDVFKLQKGATPIDFAFGVHTEVGKHCIGAKVNGRIVPLNTELNSGDTVEIITAEHQEPTRDWLDIAKSSKARNSIRKHLRSLMDSQSIGLGREIFMSALKSRQLPKKSANEINKILVKIAKKMEFATVDKLFSAIGLGSVSAKVVVKKYVGHISGQNETPEDQSFFTRLIKRSKKEEMSIEIGDLDNVLIHFAQCCNPIPGDPIVGYVTRGHGINVHRQGCTNMNDLMEKEEERLINVRWKTTEAENLAVPIRVTGHDRKNLLRDLTNRMSMLDTNIVSAEIKTNGAESICTFVVHVRNINHLNMIFQKLNNIPGVISIIRTDNYSSN